MKKILFIISILLIILSLLFCSLYVIDHKRMENNDDVVFSTWGKQYVPPVSISTEEAIEYTMQLLEEKSKETIINLNDPKVNEVVFNKTPSIYLLNEKTEVTGRTLYRIVYNTEQDGLLGPIVFYVDKFSGEVIGMDWRE